jgi:hypothetical protein
MKATHLLIALALCTGSLALKPTTAQPQMDPTLAPVHFLFGVWRSERDQTVTEEYWTPARAGTMFGCSRTMKGDKTLFFEFLRIEVRDGGLHYIAMPNGKHETAFKLVTSEPDRVVFENKEHDYPQRIIYWMDGDKLCAKIEGKKDGKEKSSTWEYERME